jgi:hypothetical protein
MIVLSITILLAAIGVAVMPCWAHSARWGYAPGVCIGLMLVGIGVFAVAGRAGGSEVWSERVPARSLARFVATMEASAIDPSRAQSAALIEWSPSSGRARGWHDSCANRDGFATD